MKENFENIYNEITKQFGEKYKPLKSKIKVKTMLYLFFLMLIISFFNTMMRNFGYAESFLYLCLKLISAIITVIVVIMALIYTNRKMNYWKFAYSFKNEVGKYFFQKINPNIKYIVDRINIDSNCVKEDVNVFLKNAIVLDVSEELDYNNIKLYTLKMNDENFKRYNGVLAVFSGCSKNITSEENWQKNLNLPESFEIIKAVFENNKFYIFFDAFQIFNYNGDNFLEKEKLERNYIFLEQLNKIENIIK